MADDSAEHYNLNQLIQKLLESGIIGKKFFENVENFLAVHFVIYGL